MFRELTDTPLPVLESPCSAWVNLPTPAHPCVIARVARLR